MSVTKERSWPSGKNEVFTSQFVEFESECYREEEKLIDYGDDQSDGEIVVVEDMNCALHLGGLPWVFSGSLSSDTCVGDHLWRQFWCCSSRAGQQFAYY